MGAFKSVSEIFGFLFLLFLVACHSSRSGAPDNSRHHFWAGIFELHLPFCLFVWVG